MLLLHVHDTLVVSTVDCQPRDRGFKSPLRQKFVLKFLLHLHLEPTQSIMGMLTVDFDGR